MNVHPPTPVSPPLIAAGLAFVVGIVTAHAGWLGPMPALVTLVTAAVGLIVVALVAGRFSQQRPQQVLVVAVALVFAAAGAWRFHLITSCYRTDHIVRYIDDERRLATIRGRIVSEPFVSMPESTLARFDFRSSAATIFTLDAAEVLTVDGFRGTCGLVQVVLHQPALHLEQGQTLQIDAWLSRRYGPRNPGQADYTNARRAARKLLMCRVSDSDAITVLAPAPPSSLFTRCRTQFRRFTQMALIDDDQQYRDPAGSDEEAVLAALILGQRFSLSPDVEELFVKSGVVHFLCVSGLHVGILAGFVWWLTTLLSASRLVRGLLTLAALVLFMLIVPCRAPVLRAALMAAVFCIGYIIRHRFSSVNILALAALVVLFWRPLDVFNPGFQLSFLVVLSIVTIAPRIYRHSPRALFNRLAGRPEPIELYDPWMWDRLPFWRYLLHRCSVRCWQLAVVCLVAWAAGLPLAAYHFQRIAWWGPVASFVMAPVITVTLILGFVQLLLAALLPLLASYLAGVLSALASFILLLARGLSHLPFANSSFEQPSIWFVVVLYMVLFLCVGALRPTARLYRYRKPLALALVVGGVAFVAVIFHRLALPHDAGAAVHVLAVGHGNAVVVEFDDHSVICCDVGSLSNFNVAHTTVLPFLRHRGYNRLRGLFISHNDIDHYAGALDLIRHRDIDAVYLSEYFSGQRSHPPLGAADQFFLDQLDRSPSRLRQDDELAVADAEIQVLWPPALDQGPMLDDNDSSLVLRIQTAHGTVLLCGDIGAYPQRTLLESYAPEDLTADVLLLPHQGSLQGLCREFVTAVAPTVIVNSSASLSDRHRMRLVQRLGDRDDILHTADHGAVSVYLSPRGPIAQTFLTPRD